MYSYVHTGMSRSMSAYVHMCMQMQMQMHMCVHMRMHVYMYMYTYMYMCEYKCVYICIYYVYILCMYTRIPNAHMKFTKIVKTCFWLETPAYSEVHGNSESLLPKQFLGFVMW